LPAGRYTITIQTGGRTYRRTVEVLPGLTNFVVFQADYNFVPTLTPPPTPTALPGPAEEPPQTATPIPEG
jgi:hypothetical protein